MERAGIEVLRVGGELDWSALPDRVQGVLFVESPLPEVRVSGDRRTSVPTLFWVHHGEHHLHMNLRLVERYRPDGVLLAHSWHLAHRFPVPIHRFPFAVAPELYPPATPVFVDRRYDVAMVGVGLRATGGRYTRRGRLVAELHHRFPHRSCFPDRVSPEELAAIYSDAKVVINEGGTKHHPITMRVFEAIGAGALLVTDPAPGIDLLLPSSQFRLLEERVADQVEALVGDPATAGAASAALSHVRRNHTYDHRVDELMMIFGSTQAQPAEHVDVPDDPFVAVIDRDADVETILGIGVGDLAGALPDRAVWELGNAPDRMSFDAVAIGSGRRETVAPMLQRAKRFVYATPVMVAPVIEELAEMHPNARITVDEWGVRAVLGSVGGYRVEQEGGS
jgi:hypothetical protein